MEQLLNDPALVFQHTPPQADEENFGQRPKAVLISLGWITLWRSYFYSATRGEGRFPLDAALGLVASPKTSELGNVLGPPHFAAGISA